MKGLLIKILAIVIMSSFAAETTVQVWGNSNTEMAATHEKEDSDKKSEEEKTEKETDKDKIIFLARQRMAAALTLTHCNRLQLIITSAYLSLPEIPPDQA